MPSRASPSVSATVPHASPLLTSRPEPSGKVLRAAVLEGQAPGTSCTLANVDLCKHGTEVRHSSEIPPSQAAQPGAQETECRGRERGP